MAAAAVQLSNGGWMGNIYTDGDYLETTRTWHSEDSPWKADQIARMIDKVGLQPGLVAEIGCGAGKILDELSRKPSLEKARFKGYDISSQAIELCGEIESNRIEFFREDPLTTASPEVFDLLLVIDVFEHVPDYLSFLRLCQAKAEYKIYHIPLDLHVSSMLRNSFFRERYTVGHLHYFTADSALAALRDTGHEIVDTFYTNGTFGTFREHPALKTAIANVPRWLFSKISLPVTARLFGGYSLMVCAK